MKNFLNKSKEDDDIVMDEEPKDAKIEKKPPKKETITKKVEKVVQPILKPVQRGLDKLPEVAMPKRPEINTNSLIANLCFEKKKDIESIDIES